jgi:hypothetical protein
MDKMLPHLTSRANKLQTGPNRQCRTIPSRHCLVDMFEQRTTMFRYEVARNNCVNTASLNRSKPGGTAALLSCILLGIPRKHNAITFRMGLARFSWPYLLDSHTVGSSENMCWVGPLKTLTLDERNGARIFLRFKRIYSGDIFELRARIEGIIAKSLHQARKVNI